MELESHKKKIFDYLKRCTASGSLAHAYLFHGQDEAAITEMATEFAKMVHCSSKGIHPCKTCKSCRDLERGAHPDVHLITSTSETSSIPVEKIRDLRRILNLNSYYGGYKIAIIARAHCLTSEASNALLKTLEEPMGDTIFILTAPTPDSVLETISSRLQLLGFPRPSPGRMVELIKKRGLDNRISQAIQVINSPVYKRLQAAERLDKTKDLEEELEAHLFIFRDILMKKIGVSCNFLSEDYGKDINIIADRYSSRTVTNTIKLIQKFILWNSTSSVNPKLTFEVLMLNL